MKVLIAEDDRVSRRVLEAKLVEWGYQAAVTRDGHEAWEVFQGANAPALAILDWMMPGLDGVELCRRLRASDPPKPTYVILLTALSTKADVVRGLEAGADDYVTKPFDPSELRARLRVGERVVRGTEALRAQRQFLRQIIDANPDLIFVTGADGKITLANLSVADLCGTTVEHLLSDPDTTVRNAKDIAQLLQDDQEVRSTRRTKRTPEQAVTNPQTGERRWFQIVKVPLFASDGTVDEVLSVATDISERRQLEEQFRQAQKMEAVGQLTGGIAHDLNNVLTAVRANADLIADALPGELRELRGDVAELQKATGRGTAMIRKLLAFSRRSTLALQPVNLSKVVADMVATLRRVLPASIEIRPIAEAEPPVARADAGAVEQMLLNLATNARDAMPDGGLLRIETGRAWLDEESRRTTGWGEPGEYACCSVSDTGVGMDAATRARVFEPFFTTKPPGLGTGLGLAMVYGLMKQHGGFLNLYSEPGRGTTVKLYFPLSHEPEAERAAPTTPPPPPRGCETILVADDEEAIRRAAKRVLERLGYRVILAQDGEQALTLFAAHESEVALLLTDVVMPGLGGHALYERVRGEGKKVPFLFSSGYTARDVRENNALDPSLPFLHKPWTFTELAHRVREVLDAAAKSVQ